MSSNHDLELKSVLSLTHESELLYSALYTQSPERILTVAASSVSRVLPSITNGGPLRPQAGVVAKRKPERHRRELRISFKSVGLGCGLAEIKPGEVKCGPAGGKVTLELQKKKSTGALGSNQGSTAAGSCSPEVSKKIEGKRDIGEKNDGKRMRIAKPRILPPLKIVSYQTGLRRMRRSETSVY